MKYIFSGDRDISVLVLRELLRNDLYPEALLVSEKSMATHAEELMALSGLPKDRILFGRQFESHEGIELMKEIHPEYIIGVHFPYIIRDDVLAIPAIGFLNLHPAFLPFNRGWHTPTWAILEGTPIGASLHFMSKELDNGDLIHQKELKIKPCDTANTLYKRLKCLELEVFKEALPLLMMKSFKRKPLNLIEGTSHKRSELFSSLIQRINMQEFYQAAALIDKIRALTTNQWSEAAYFEEEGKKYRIRIEIQEDEL